MTAELSGAARLDGVHRLELVRSRAMCTPVFGAMGAEDLRDFMERPPA